MKVKLNLEREVYQIMHPKLRRLVEDVLDGALDYFWTMRASKNHHPPDERGGGGTVLHVKRAFVVAKHLCTAFGFVGFDRELILTATLLHDVCKAGAGNKGAGHTVGGHERLLGKRYGQKEPIVHNEYWERVKRLVETHEGLWGESKPETIPEMIVHLADYIASRSNIRVLLEED